MQLCRWNLDHDRRSQSWKHVGSRKCRRAQNAGSSITTPRSSGTQCLAWKVNETGRQPTVLHYVVSAKRYYLQWWPCGTGGARSLATVQIGNTWHCSPKSSSTPHSKLQCFRYRNFGCKAVYLSMFVFYVGYERMCSSGMGCNKASQTQQVQFRGSTRSAFSKPNLHL